MQIKSKQYLTLWTAKYIFEQSGAADWLRDLPPRRAVRRVNRVKSFRFCSWLVITSNSESVATGVESNETKGVTGWSADPSLDGGAGVGRSGSVVRRPDPRPKGVRSTVSSVALMAGAGTKVICCWTPAPRLSWPVLLLLQVLFHGDQQFYDVPSRSVLPRFDTCEREPQGDWHPTLVSAPFFAARRSANDMWRDWPLLFPSSTGSHPTTHVAGSMLR